MAQGTEATSTLPDESIRQPQMPLMMYPIFVPGQMPMENPEQADRGPGIYAVPVVPFSSSVVGLTSNTLVPFDYNMPVRPNLPEGGADGREHGQDNRQQLQPPHRQVVVRRLQFGFQLDLLLILKLAAVIFVFNQDGSRQRLLMLLMFAAIAYLYQTGALMPLVRWLSQGMHRAPAPRRQRPAARAENGVANPRLGDENVRHGEDGIVNENQLAQNMNDQVVEDNNMQDNGRRDGAIWQGIIKEIRMIVVSFITSLLPGYRNAD